MPHSCIGALNHYLHSFVDYITSDEAKWVIEAAAAGAAIYHTVWRSAKPVLLAAIVFTLASISVTKLHISDATLFAHRMRPCLYPPALKMPSPEPVKNSPNRAASLGSEKGELSTWRSLRPL